PAARRRRRLPARSCQRQGERRARTARLMVQRARLPAVRSSLLRRSDLRRQCRQGVLEDDRLSRSTGNPRSGHGGISRQAIPRRAGSKVDRRLQLRKGAMAQKLKQRTVVICGGGFTAGLIARQLTAKNIDVLVLERGGDHTRAAEAKLPSQ